MSSILEFFKGASVINIGFLILLCVVVFYILITIFRKSGVSKLSIGKLNIENSSKTQEEELQEVESDATKTLKIIQEMITKLGNLEDKIGEITGTINEEKIEKLEEGMQEIHFYLQNFDDILNFFNNEKKIFTNNLKEHIFNSAYREITKIFLSNLEEHYKKYKTFSDFNNNNYLNLLIENIMDRYLKEIREFFFEYETDIYTHKIEKLFADCKYELLAYTNNISSIQEVNDDNIKLRKEEIKNNLKKIIKDGLSNNIKYIIEDWINAYTKSKNKEVKK